MELLNRNQAIWLARGVALGIILRRCCAIYSRVTGQLRYTSLAGRRLPKGLGPQSRSSIKSARTPPGDLG
jgi:hypothetical protein